MTTSISIAGYGALPASATPVWIVSYGAAPPASITATEAKIAGYGGPPAGATVVRIIGYGPTPPTGATVMWISGRQTTTASLPVNTTAPAISGTATVGSTISCTTGTWSNSPTSYAYQWMRGGVAISGATSATYVTVSADGGTSLTCVVTATNAAGSVSATSNALSIAAAASSTWSTADATTNSAHMTLSNSNMTFTGGGSSVPTLRGTTSHTSGKWYVEFLAVATTSADYVYFGLASSGFNAAGGLGASNYSFGASWQINDVSTGFTANYTSPLTPVNNDVWGFAVDFTAGSVWIAQNNVWINSSNPATGTLPITSFTPATVGALFYAMGSSGATEKWTLQPTSASQKYAPPSGFTAWG